MGAISLMRIAGLLIVDWMATVPQARKLWNDRTATSLCAEDNLRENVRASSSNETAQGGAEKQKPSKGGSDKNKSRPKSAAIKTKAANGGFWFVLFSSPTESTGSAGDSASD